MNESQVLRNEGNAESHDYAKLAREAEGFGQPTSSALDKGPGNGFDPFSAGSLGERLAKRPDWHGINPPAPVAKAWAALQAAVVALEDAVDAKAGLKAADASAEKAEKARLVKAAEKGEAVKARPVDFSARELEAAAVVAAKANAARAARKAYDAAVTENLTEWSARLRKAAQAEVDSVAAAAAKLEAAIGQAEIVANAASQATQLRDKDLDESAQAGFADLPWVRPEAREAVSGIRRDYSSDEAKRFGTALGEKPWEMSRSEREMIMAAYRRGDDGALARLASLASLERRENWAHTEYTSMYPDPAQAPQFYTEDDTEPSAIVF